MKRLFFLVIAVALLWSGYWVVGSSGVKSAFENWFEARRAEGWVAEYDDFDITGFPNRFDATWEGLTLADPESGVAWTMPMFQILALSYQPNHVIAAWPHKMRLSAPGEQLTIDSDLLRASLRLNPGTALELEKTVLEGRNLSFSGAQIGSLRELHLAAERTEEATYRIGLTAADLSPPARALQSLVGDQALPETMQQAHLDATVTFDRPWDRTAIEDSRPQPTRIDLADLKMIWGVMEFQAKGQIDLDAQGRATGKMALQAVHWKEMLKIAVASGAVPESAAEAAQKLLGMAANAKGNPNSLDVELTLKEGTVYLGFLPLGPAPLIRLP